MENKRALLYVLGETRLDQRSLIQAFGYEKQPNSHIHFLRVFESLKSIAMLLGVSMAEIRNILLSKLEEEASIIESDEGGVSISCHVREGVWFVEAILEAERIGAEMMIVDGSPKRDLHLTSNAMHLIRKSSIPVLWPRKIKFSDKIRILVLVTCDINNNVKRSSNTICMRLAEEIAKSSAAEIHVMHCWTLFNEYYLRECATKVPQKAIDEMLNREQKLHETWMESFCLRYSHVNLSGVHLIKGDTEEEVPKLLKSMKIDLLVMATVDQIDTPGLYISTSAETIIEKSACSLLAVKPDGFISPVKKMR